MTEGWSEAVSKSSASRSKAKRLSAEVVCTSGYLSSGA